MRRLRIKINAEIIDGQYGFVETKNKTCPVRILNTQLKRAVEVKAS